MTLPLSACGLFSPSEDKLRDDIVDVALDQVGEDYHYGGASPGEGFDCSGLAYYSYAKAGIKLPRSAAEQHKVGKAVKFDDAEPGDLVFYNFHDRKKTDLHVVVYLGRGRGVHAPVSGGEVEKVDLTAPEWRKRYIGARRIVRES